MCLLTQFFYLRELRSFVLIVATALLLAACSTAEQNDSADFPELAASNEPPPVAAPTEPEEPLPVSPDEGSDDDVVNDQEPVAEIVTKQPPSGIFHSASSLAFSSNSKVGRTLLADESVAGTLLKVSWDQLHFGDEDFDLSLLERELENALALGLKVTIAISDSKEIPQFVKDQCEIFNYDFRGLPETTCLPWDEVYQAYKKQLLDEVAARFDDHDSLAGMYITYAAMSNGAEMHWRVDEASFTAAGYTEARLIQSYQDIVDLYVAAFQKTAIIMEVHEVFDSAALASYGYEHCYSEVGARCGVAMWWCSERMTEGAEDDVWPIVQMASSMSFTVCQTVGNFTNEPERFESNGTLNSAAIMQDEIEFFQLQGITVWELWTADLENPALLPIVEDLSEDLARDL